MMMEDIARSLTAALLHADHSILNLGVQRLTESFQLSLRKCMLANMANALRNTSVVSKSCRQ